MWRARSFVARGDMLYVTFSDLIGLPKTKTAESAQPRNRSTVYNKTIFLWIGRGVGRTLGGVVIFEQQRKDTT